MKNLKKLSAAFFTAVLLSSGLTSCIDNEVSPLVESIYANQAELLAAQTAVQNANATLLQAQAAVQEANAAHQAAITAAFELSSAQDLLEQIAATELAVEEARLAMLLAQADFDRDMAAILAAIRTAQNNEAGQHAADYVTAMGQIATLNGTKLTTQQSIATKELYMKSAAAGSEMTWAVYLASLEQDVLAKQASVTANEEFIVRANAYYAGDYADMVDALAVAKAAQTAKGNEITALENELGNEMIIGAGTAANPDTPGTGILGNIEALGGYATYIATYEALLADLEGDGTETAAPISGLEGNLAFYEASVETLTDTDIPALELAISDYATAKGLLETAVSDQEAIIGDATAGLVKDVADATTAHADLVTALGTDLGTPLFSDAKVTTTDAYSVLWNLKVDLAVVVEDIANLFASYQTAITDLSSAQATFDGGSGFDTAATSLAVTNAENGILTAKANYDTYYSIWDANKNGVTVFDNASPIAASGFTESFANTFVGDHTDMLTSYAVAQTLTETATGSGVYHPAALDATLVTAKPADVPAVLAVAGDLPTLDVFGVPAVVGSTIVAAQTHVFYTAPVAFAALETPANNITYYLDVEADDVVETNIDLVNYMIAQLGDELPATTSELVADKKGTTDAYAVLWDAQIDHNIATAGVAAWPVLSGLVAAQEVFDYQKDLYENELTRKQEKIDAVTAQETVIGTATVGTTPGTGLILGVEDALETKTDLIDALGTDLGTPAAGDAKVTVAAPAVLDAYEVLWNAELALADFMVKTKADLEAELVTANENLVTATNMVSEIKILITRAEADLAALKADYDALIATPLYAELQVRVLEIADELAVLNAEKAVLDAEVTALAIVVSFEGLTTTTAIDNAINTAQGVIDGAPAYYDMKAAQIAAGEVSVANLEAEVAKLKADLVDLDARIAAKVVEAEGYLALLNAALGN